MIIKKLNPEETKIVATIKDGVDKIKSCQQLEFFQELKSKHPRITAIIPGACRKGGAITWHIKISLATGPGDPERLAILKITKRF